jgi:hypothetical protein
VRHYSPDNGYDAPIPVTCNWNSPWSNYQMVAEGQSSTCHDSDGFYVGLGKIVSCLGVSDYWHDYGGGPRWVKVIDTEDLRCVHQLA